MLAFWVALASGPGLADVTQIKSEHVSLEFRSTGHNLYFDHFKLEPEQVDMIDGGSTLFRIDYQDPSGILRHAFAHSHWDEVAISATGSAVDFQLKLNNAFHVHVSLKIEGGAVIANAKITNISPTVQLNAFHFPYIELNGLSPEGKSATLAYPSYSGRLESDVFRPGNSFGFNGTYPSGAHPLQFGAVYGDDVGLYIATHDPKHFTKEITWQTLRYPSHQRLLIDYSWPVPTSSASFQLPGEQVLQRFKGDWFDATQIYRRWVKAVKPEVFQHPESRAAIRDIGFWIADSCTISDRCVERMRSLKDEFNVPLALHWYSWHQIPFDQNYPHYFPAIPEFGQIQADLAASQIKVMPYINALQWDTALPDFPQSEALMSKNGEFVIFPNTTLGAMCATSDLFHTTLGATGGQLYGHGGVSGLYLDQLSAIAPLACHNAAHDHPRFGGNWWTEQGTFDLLDQMRASGPATRFLTSEWVNESYVGKIDGFLTNNFTHNESIPMFNAVYNDAVITFGRFHWEGPDFVKAYRMKLGQALVYGNQLGWVAKSVAEDPAIRAMSIDSAQLRYSYRAYFDGVMLRPPVINTTLSNVSADWNYYWYPTLVELPPVLSGAFANGNKAISVFINISEAQVALVCNDTRKSLAPGQAWVLAEQVQSCVARSVVEL